jgi:hypothetical protein
MKNRKSRRKLVSPKPRTYILPFTLACLMGVFGLLWSRTAEAAVSVSRAGAAPNFIANFNDDGNAPQNNDLVLRFNTGTQNLEFSLNGGAFTNNLGGGNTATFANINTINANLGSNDTLEINLQTFRLWRR